MPRKKGSKNKTLNETIEVEKEAELPIINQEAEEQINPLNMSIEGMLKREQDELHTHCHACHKPLVGFVVGGGKKFCNDECMLEEYPDAFGPR